MPPAAAADDDDAPAAVAGDDNAAAGAPVSKSQLKKRARAERRAESVRAKKEAGKAARHAETARKRAATAALLGAMPAAELEAWRAVRREKLSARREDGAARRARLAAAVASGQRIVIDLEFAHLMTDGELRSMCAQAAQAYAANARAAAPAHLILTGVAGPMAAALRRQVAGLENWVATAVEAPLAEHFGPDRLSDLVYLTADSPHELAELDPTKAYVVGGIVDRNRHKGLCAAKAAAAGVATARLPIGAHLALRSSQVMCTNHVVEVLLKWGELRDWGAALDAVVPIRKRRAAGEAGAAGAAAGAGADAAGGEAAAEPPGADAAAAAAAEEVAAP